MSKQITSSQSLFTLTSQNSMKPKLHKFNTKQNTGQKRRNHSLITASLPSKSSQQDYKPQPLNTKTKRLPENYSKVMYDELEIQRQGVTRQQFDMIVKSTEVIYDMMDDMFKPQNMLRYSIEDAMTKSRNQMQEIQSKVLNQVS